jgi:hypothetical protein
MTLDELIARLRREDPPLPEVTVEHRAVVPGWALRLAFTLAVPLFVYAVGTQAQAAPGFVATVALATMVWAAAKPGPNVSYLTVVIAAPLLLNAPGPFAPAALWLAPLGYAMTRLAWWAAHIGLRAHVELAALGRAAARDAVVILITVAVGSVALSLAGQPIAAVAALGSVALAALAWSALRRDDGDERRQN